MASNGEKLRLPVPVAASRLSLRSFGTRSEESDGEEGEGKKLAKKSSTVHGDVSFCGGASPGDLSFYSSASMRREGHRVALGSLTARSEESGRKKDEGKNQAKKSSTVHGDVSFCGGASPGDLSFYSSASMRREDHRIALGSLAARSEESGEEGNEAKNLAKKSGTVDGDDSFCGGASRRDLSCSSSASMRREDHRVALGSLIARSEDAGAEQNHKKATCCPAGSEASGGASPSCNPEGPKEVYDLRDQKGWRTVASSDRKSEAPTCESVKPPTTRHPSLMGDEANTVPLRFTIKSNAGLMRRAPLLCLGAVEVNGCKENDAVQTSILTSAGEKGNAKNEEFATTLSHGGGYGFPHPPPFYMCKVCAKRTAVYKLRCCGLITCDLCDCDHNTVKDKLRKEKLPKVKLEGYDLFLWQPFSYPSSKMLCMARRSGDTLKYYFASIDDLLDKEKQEVSVEVYAFKTQGFKASSLQITREEVCRSEMI
ncbi:hypothetical protein ACP4OV_006064 [Aristida adscensionis]